MTMQNPQPYVKPERVDHSYNPITFQPPQSHQPLTNGTQRQPAPRPQQPVNQHGTKYSAPAQKTTTPAPTEKKDLESQPDFPSIKGIFGWTTIDDVNVPYILRSDKHYVSVRIVEMKLLSRYPNSYPDDLGKHAPLTSFFITDNEAKLLNEINIQHCDGEYGKKDFTTKDLIVLLTDFHKFYELVKKTFPDANTAKAENQKAGWLQIKNTVTPYLSRVDGKYVPLSVIQYAAGLLTNEKIASVSPSKGECDTLNYACGQAGVEFTFSEANRLIKIKDLLRINPVDIIALPSTNPLKHATYMELPTKNNTNKPENKPQQQPVSQKTQQPYRFQPNANLDLINRIQQETVKGSGNEAKERERRERAAREHTERAREQQQVNFPGHNIAGVPMFDPRLAAMYRHPYGMPRFMPPNQAGMQAPMLDPLAQYFLSLQQGVQNQSTQGPPNQQAPPGGIIPGREAHTRSPGSSSSTNPSPRSRPPSQSRPSSGSRPPSQPSASPLSPTQLSGRSESYTQPALPVAPHPSQLPPPYPGLNLHHLQTMFQQRYHVPFPPQAHKQSVSPKQATPKTSQPSNNAGINNPASVVNGNYGQATTLIENYTNPLKIPQQHAQPGTHQHTRHPSGNNTNSTKHDSQKSPGRTAPVVGPPPLILMMPTNSSVTPQNGLVDSPHAVNIPSHHEHDQISAVTGLSPVGTNTSITPVLPKPVTLTPAVHPESVTPVQPPQPVALLSPNSAANVTTPAQPQSNGAISDTIVKSVYVDRIQGAWLNNKSISCLHLDGPDRQGGYCLVEAVCKLYFNGCSVTEFLFALEKVLNVTLLTCNLEEEKAFIQYYNLPVDVLKCNKLIKFEDLETFFPQLSYMFPDKNSQDMLCSQEASDVLEADNNNMNKYVPNGVTPEELANSMPMTMSEMGAKRNSDLFDIDVTKKKPRMDDNDDDAVIILD